jgi:hypothetical protein
MKHALLVLLVTLSASVHAQGSSPWTNERFTPEHQQEKQREQLAIALRVEQLQGASNDRKEVQYAENRGRCQAALRVADLCGKFAGTFYCDARGFRPIAANAAALPVVMDNGTRNRMEHCALAAATGRKRSP